MAERRATTKAELMDDIDSSWHKLNEALGRLTEEQMTDIRDAQGWTVKDHVIHMTAWERSVVFFLQGKPRHEGIGVGEALYSRGDDDEINDAVYQERKDMPLDEAMSQFRQVHGQLVDLVQSLSDADLQKPYRHYLPKEAGQEGGRTAINTLYGNTSGHFKEHLGWIEELVGNANKD